MSRYRFLGIEYAAQVRTANERHVRNASQKCLPTARYSILGGGPLPAGVGGWSHPRRWLTGCRGRERVYLDHNGHLRPLTLVLIMHQYPLSVGSKQRRLRGRWMMGMASFGTPAVKTRRGRTKLWGLRGGGGGGDLAYSRIGLRSRRVLASRSFRARSSGAWNVECHRDGASV